MQRASIGRKPVVPAMRLLIAIVVWIGALAAAAEVSTLVAHKVGKEQATASFDASHVQAADPASLFHAANLAKVLAVERKHLGTEAKFNSFVMYPGYLSLTQVTGGSEANVYIDANGKYELLNTGGNPGSSPVFSLAHVTGDVPAAIAQRIATRTHFPVSQLHYMVLQGDSDSRRLSWLIYPVHGTRIEYFQTSGPHGHLLELVKNSPTGLTRVR